MNRVTWQLNLSQAELLFPDAGRTDVLGWLRKGNALPILKENRLEAIFYRFMHHGTVSVALDVCINALRLITPKHFANLFARDQPIAEISELVSKHLSVFRCCEVDECITLVQFSPEVE